MKIHKIQGDISKEVASSFKKSVSVDCEMQGLVPGRDKLSLITLTSDDENIYIVQPDKNTYNCLLYTSPSPRDGLLSRMPSSA